MCFSLYAATNALQRAYAPLLKPSGLTYPQYLALVVLWELREATVGEIGRRLFLDSGTLTPVLKRIAALGYLTRERDPADERSVIVALTPRGRELETELATIQRDIACTTALSTEELFDLRDRLHDLRKNVNALQPPS